MLNVPEEMKALPQWVIYRVFPPRNGKLSKYMMNPRSGLAASVSRPRDWTDFETAYQAMKDRHCDGLAFVLTNGIVFVDIDHALKNGEYSGTAREILAAFPNTYAETSVSGTGLHIFCRGNLPENSRNRNRERDIEIYDTARFACMTGKQIGESKELRECSAEVATFCEVFMKREMYPEQHPTVSFRILNDEELIARIQSSRFGEKFERLLNGDCSDYPSRSEADFAFICAISRWTKNREQIERIYRNSGLYRGKWDERRGNRTYGEITLEHAFEVSR